ncbi:molybdopterin biosynthesis protein [Desulfohalobiaceae bacterium Ax17]|uniref:molybdopterin biosynthesis protein n=1 Tax=Desulfovulcanus ferrireducens TaxID=2831190 RepID=UPI00207BAFAC|nr:molybdopterin biosynthesis protein [Desulfovulcanus ferrireducens]MBT8764163.1 molybdopterin biosynthesis protein [Desulfovulcanus ferrireducens]
MSNKRHIYLQTIEIEEAIHKVKHVLQPSQLVQKEMVPTHDAVRRITAAPIWAKYSSPTFHSAAMDGVAVKADKTFQAREGSPVYLKKEQDYIEVNTGNPLPEGMDAVIMIENIVQVDDDTIAIEQPAFPWQHVRRIGEDIVATELLLPQNHELSPYDIGALLSAGIWDVEVWEKVKILIIPTGDEVLDFRLRPKPKAGQVVDSNSQVLASMAKSWGCDVQTIAPVPDDVNKLEAAVDQALNSSAHVVVIGAGSSAGSKDFTRQIMERFGQVLVHGIKAMPGKPSLLGEARGKLLVGAPGYPVSAVICFEQLLKPIVHWLGRKVLSEPEKIEVELTRRVPSKLGVREFLRLSIGRVGDKYVATPLARGAGMITTLTKAQGMTIIEEKKEGLEEGAIVPAVLLRNKKELDQVLVAVGSHDNTLDLLANELMGLSQPIRLSSTHVGSMGGLMAVKKGSTHLAGIHLFDPETGDYNFPFIDKYIPGLEFKLINLAIRHQGLIVAKGNPKNIKGIDDLTRKDVRLINRQRGAGTRILLDHHLKTAGISPNQVNGYDKEEFTHMAVAVNVLSGAADCGLGIYAAAKALGLDFVPLAKERYDLLIPDFVMQDEKVQAVLEFLNNDAFKNKILALGGYEVDLTGQEMKPSGQRLD